MLERFTQIQHRQQEIRLIVNLCYPYGHSRLARLATADWQSMLDESSAIGVQAADFLAIEDHVRDACKTLARKLFVNERGRSTATKSDVQTQVLLHARAAQIAREHSDEFPGNHSLIFSKSRACDRFLSAPAQALQHLRKNVPPRIGGDLSRHACMLWYYVVAGYFILHHLLITL
jgi:hypothetical protein